MNIHSIYLGMMVFALFLIAFGIVGIFFSVYGAKVPENRIVRMVGIIYFKIVNFVRQGEHWNYKRVFAFLLTALLVSLLLGFAAPFVLLTGLVIFYFKSDSSTGNNKTQPWQYPPIEVVRYALFVTIHEFSGKLPLTDPIDVTDLAIQPVVLRGMDVFQICIAKDNIPVSKQDAEIMRRRLNKRIAAHLQNGDFPGVVCPSHNGTYPLFTIILVKDRGTYWDFFVLYTLKGFQQFDQYKAARINSQSTLQKQVERKISEISKNVSIPLGCFDDNLLKENLIMPIMWDCSKSAHILLNGSTGSGKTTAAKQVLMEVSNLIPNSQITLCDFKAEDFSFLNGASRYYSFRETLNGLNSFYAEFEDRQAGTDTSRTFKLLAFDEWASFLNMLDKKEAEAAKIKLATLLMLGRSFNVHVMIIQQRGDSQYFNTARDNFNIIISLGNISKESAQMFGFDREQMESVRNPGQGYMMTNGTNMQPVRFPPIADESTSDEMIRSAVVR